MESLERKWKQQQQLGEMTFPSFASYNHCIDPQDEEERREMRDHAAKEFLT